MTTLMQSSPNEWSCLAVSYAIALATPFHEILQEVGHDGSEIVFPDLTNPMNRRAFHPQEFVDSCLVRGYVPLHIEAVPVMTPDGKLYATVTWKEGNGVRLSRFMHNYKGILIGQDSRKRPHAVAWDSVQCLDCNGCKVYSESGFGIREFVALIPVTNNIF